MRNWFQIPDPPEPKSMIEDEQTPTPEHPVINGIDVLERDNFKELRDLRLGIVANQSSVTVDGRRSIDALAQCEDIHLLKIFSPEHGLSGSEDAKVADTQDAATQLPVFSLYSAEGYKPTPQHLHGLDALLYDLQDIGCRFYTYITTLGLILEACAESDIRVYVLDRPNLIGGLAVEGPCSDVEHESFVAYHEVPLRHGMTVGELARLFNVERGINADLRVVTMGGWQRAYWFSHTGQQWINPSPNIRDQAAAALYPGVGLIEGTNVSVGRGTPAPFHIFGAPWLDGGKLCTALTQQNLPALRFEPVAFTPLDKGHRYYNELCQGVHFVVEDEQEFSPAVLGLALIQTLRQLYTNEWQYHLLDKLLARTDLLEAIEDQAAELADLWEPDPDFFEARARALLY